MSRRPGALMRGAKRKDDVLAGAGCPRCSPRSPRARACPGARPARGGRGRRGRGRGCRRRAARRRRWCRWRRGRASAAGRASTPSGRADARDDGEREADGGEPLVGEAALGAVRVEERERRQRRVGHAVVIDDDDVEARAADALEALVVARAAVARDEEGGARREDALERQVGQPVAPAEAVGQERDHLAAERAQRCRSRAPPQVTPSAS